MSFQSRRSFRGLLLAQLWRTIDIVLFIPRVRYTVVVDGKEIERDRVKIGNLLAYCLMQLCLLLFVSLWD
jgi:hypothetical protein